MVLFVVAAALLPLLAETGDISQNALGKEAETLHGSPVLPSRSAGITTGCRRDGFEAASHLIDDEERRKKEATSAPATAANVQECRRLPPSACVSSYPGNNSS